ncbi:hypothetical protein HELRODRAFT_164937 [Helobdella robusta]|uniref:Apple domain-containing protein n=1 Tax=Helobdella robusta TaxID=6412 RepID=T1EVZ8_HELRO|nr:hypothetical protein HELRODRAFT_164937 [Helobdella robusta]ESN92814.1 hypothetical protein HELRODRAFT_164937 [Helobdella robusta]
MTSFQTFVPKANFYLNRRVCLSDIALLSVQTYRHSQNSVGNAKCFKRHLNSQQKNECRCDQPLAQTTFNNKSISEALLSCSFICSKSNDCQAFNFQENSKTCQIFCAFSDVFNRTLTVFIDFELEALYLDGVSQVIPPGSYGYSTTVRSDVKIIAIQAINLSGEKYIEAYTRDGYILTNTTWKCSGTLPTRDANNNSWYDLNYDDASWMLAIDQYQGSTNIYGATYIWSSDLFDAYCRRKLCG